MDKGYFCAPTIAVDVPLDHYLWKTEMFLPILMVAPIKSLEEAMQIANDIDYGLTAGFYGNDEETDGSSITSKPVQLMLIAHRAAPPVHGRIPTLVAGKAQVLP